MANEKSLNNQHTDSIIEKAIRLLPGGTLGNVPLYPENPVIIREGRGSKIYDTAGREYIDYLLGSGPMILGHAHPAIVDAVQKQVALGSTFFATNELAILLADELVKAIPCAEQIRFTSSGTEATFYALRVARAYSRRDKILKFEGGFHGMHDYSVMSLAPKNPPPFPNPEPWAAGVPKLVQDTVLVAPFNNLEITTDLIRQHGDELGAVIVEPFQRVLPPRPGFLEGLREITKQYQIPLIFDEVVTGFRFAYGGAQEFYKVVPDLAAYGKIIGGGYPLGAVAGSRVMMEVFDPGIADGNSYVPQIGTLSGNPVAAAAGLATLQELKKPGVYDRLFATGRTLKKGLEQLLQETEIEGQVVGEDPNFDVYFTNQDLFDYRSTRTGNPGLVDRFVRALLERGIFRGEQKFYISLAHDQRDLDRTLEACKKALETLRS